MVLINVLYAGNQRMFKGLIMSLTCLASNTKEDLNVFIITGNFLKINSGYVAFNKKEIDFLEKIIKIYNPNNKITLLDMSCLEDELMNSTNKNTKFTPYTLLRLYIDDEVFSSLDKRLLYMDIDTMCFGDIKELYNFDLKGKTLGMVRDNVGRHWIHKNYCNAGMILFDVDKTLENKDKIIKAREMIRTVKMFMPDQTAINRAFKNDIEFLPSKYNEQNKMEKDTLVRHYCGVLKFFPYMHIIKVKPWDDDIEKFHKQRKEHVMDKSIEITNEFVRQYKNNEEPHLIK